MDRSARTLIAIALLTIAGFLGAELLIRRAPLGEWALAGLLALVGLVVLWLGIRPERPAAPMPALVPQPELAHSPALVASVPVVALPPVAPVAAQVVPVVEAAPPPRPTPAEADDLKVIDGIGPKLAEALNRSGVRTFAQLATMNGAALREVVAAANVRVVGDLIETWPEQAKLAAAGDWAGLRAWIAAHKAHSGD